MTATYIATAEGYYGGALITPDDGPFPADFRAFVRDQDAKPIFAGKRDASGNFVVPPTYPLKYDAKGNPVRGELLIPSWAVPVDDVPEVGDEYVAPVATVEAITDDVIKKLVAAGWGPSGGNVDAAPVALAADGSAPWPDGPVVTDGEGEGSGEGEGEKLKFPPLPAGVSRMKRDELIELAAAREVDLGADVDSLKRDDIAAMIMAAPNPAV